MDITYSKYVALIVYQMCCCLLSSANKCLLKVGAYCAQLEQYQKAIEIYEQVCTYLYVVRPCLPFTPSLHF